MSDSSARARLTLLTFQDIDLPSTFTADFISELVTAFEFSDVSGNLLHSIRVATVANYIGKEIQFSSTSLKELFFASLFHDIGGTSVNVHISKKLVEIPDVFGQKTDFHIFAHPTRGYYILNKFPTLHKIGEIVLAHHEFYDGSGFPRGIKEKEIPILARIIRIADTVDIILRTHDIKNADELDSFLSVISGEEFDPELYTAFITLLKRDNLFPKFNDYEAVKVLFKEIKDKMKDQYYLATTDTVNRFMETVAIITDNVTAPEKQHSIRVAEFAEQIAFSAGLDQAEILNVRWAAFLHDIGKLALNRSLYYKTEKLTDSEWKMIRTHPEKSYNIINNVSGLQKLAYYVLYHHENYDGSGYPENLSGSKIPLVSRILRVADAFEAMTSERTYHRKKDWEMALKELKKHAGKQFDPGIVEIAVNHYAK